MLLIISFHLIHFFYLVIDRNIAGTGRKDILCLRRGAVLEHIPGCLCLFLITQIKQGQAGTAQSCSASVCFGDLWNRSCLPLEGIAYQAVNGGKTGGGHHAHGGKAVGKFLIQTVFHILITACL